MKWPLHLQLRTTTTHCFDMEILACETSDRNEFHPEVNQDHSVPETSSLADQPLTLLHEPTTLAQQSENPEDISLKELFDASHQPLEQPVWVCKQIEPFVAAALKIKPNSRVLLEVAAFIKAGTKATPDSGWQCTMTQLHAIVHLLNNGEMLIQTNIDATDKHTLDADEREFLAQLEDCAI
jgi:hypothetical protein